MERFRGYLRRGSHEESFYDFERAEVDIRGAKKKGGEGCDHAVLTTRGGDCQLVLVECKGGGLGISDFERGRRQLEDSVDFVKRAFDDPPDLAVICYERSSAPISNLLRVLSNRRLRHNVRLVLRRFSEAGYCSACSYS